MHFILFLWNCFARTVGFLAFLMIEIGVFWFILQVLNQAELPIAAGILKVVFVIWIIFEVFMRIFVGGFKNLISYIIRI